MTTPHTGHPMTGGLRHEDDDDKFLILPRPTVRDERLSFRARGVLALLADLPPGWDVNAPWLVKQGREGREAIYSALSELRAAGYYRVEKRRGEGGRWVSGTAVSKTARPAWAAEYAEQETARAAKRDVPESIYDPQAPADLRVSDLREAVGRKPGSREPVGPKEERERRIGTESLPTGEGAHASAHMREVDDDPPQLALVAEPEKPAVPAKGKRGKAGRVTRSQVPLDWAPSPELWEWTEENVPGIPRSEVEHFINRHRSKGDTFVDFDAAWRTWTHNWVSFGSKGSTLGGSRPGRSGPYRNPPEEPTQESLRAGWESAGTTAGGNW